MNRKKLVATVVLLTIAFFGLSAEGKKLKAPKKGEVVVVGKCYSESSIDQKFFDRYFRTISFRGPNTMVAGYQSAVAKKSRDNLSPFGDTFYQYAKVRGDGKILIEGYTVFLRQNSWAHFYLPVNVDLTIPEGAKYVYLGTIKYTFSNEYFEIDDISRADDFDEEAATLKKKFGDKAELVRVAISESNYP